MGPSEEAGVGNGVETHRMTPDSDLQLRLLGPLTVSRNGQELALPGSRKVRALIGYLALAPHAAARGQLCDLLWDVPNDPRSELRWCLSKIRGVLDEPGRPRVTTGGDRVGLDVSGCFVDAIEIERALHAGIETLSADRLRALAALFKGEFLEGLEIDRSPLFYGWLTTQRRRLRDIHAALLERLVKIAPEDDVSGHLDRWLALAPFDPRVHALLFDSFAARGRVREAEEHLAATARLFDAEGLDHAEIRRAWNAARARAERSPRVQLAAVHPPAKADAAPNMGPRRASIAVMPFDDRSEGGGSGGGSADGLVHDVITRLAKLRSLFVIAQGTVFALQERGIGPDEAGRMLNVDYVVGGSLLRRDKRLSVTVELSETRSGRIVWADQFDHSQADAFLVLDEIGNRIVASIANEIETLERNRAMLKPPNSLDAWEAHHRGLWHMYRFQQDDNERARHFFEAAVRLDPTFARAYAGLSFTHWQNAFQGWAERETEIERAFAAAGQSLMADDRDPAAHWAMGRALWLRRVHDQSLVELERAVDLSPNFALGHYTLAFVHAQSGDPAAAIRHSDQSRHLSPFDPLLFAILCSRAMALVRLGRFDEAADWAAKGVARPNAHAHTHGIAAYCLALAGRRAEADAQLTAIRRTLPRYGIDDFLNAFHFDPDTAQLFRKAAKGGGLD